MSEDCNKCSEQKKYVRSYTKKKGDPSSNRIGKKSQFHTLRRYYQSFKKKVRYHGSKIMGLRI